MAEGVNAVGKVQASYPSKRLRAWVFKVRALRRATGCESSDWPEDALLAYPTSIVP